MSGLIGRKIGMTSIFENGKNIPCTVIEAGPCVASQNQRCWRVRSVTTRFRWQNEKHSTKAALGHFKAGTVAKKSRWIQDFCNRTKLGDLIDVSIFVEGEFVDVQGVSKGKGFQGL
jgi:large subunit ribosomal protein L3